MIAATLVRRALIDDIEFPCKLGGAIERPIPVQMLHLTAVGTAQLPALNEWDFLHLRLAVHRS